MVTKGVNLTSEKQSGEDRISACVYILHMLLQRAEQQQPGTLEQMIEGVAADRAGVPAGMPSKDEVDRVFAEALQILSLARDQLKLLDDH